jgi:excisionase family DNA binding protein
MAAAPSDPDRTGSEELTRHQRLRDLGTSDPLLLTPEEAANALRVGRTTLYALLKMGELRPIHIGRSCRIFRLELERYVRHLQSPPQPPTPRQRRGAVTTDQAGLFEVVHTSPDAP